MRKVFTSLIVLCMIPTIGAVEAWANSIARGPANTSWLQGVATSSAATGTPSWNPFQA